jgi:hypothetical protein
MASLPVSATIDHQLERRSSLFWRRLASWPHWQHAVAQGEIHRVRHERREVGRQSADETLLLSEAGQEREVDIGRHALLAPAQQRHSADEAIAPVMAPAVSVHFLRGIEQVRHVATSRTTPAVR